MALGTDVGFGPGNIVLHGDPATLPKKTTEPFKFSAHLYCGQMAGCVKMPLSMEVGFSPGHIVLDEDPAGSSPAKGAHQPPPLSFRPMSIVAAVVHLSYC